MHVCRRTMASVASAVAQAFVVLLALPASAQSVVTGTVEDAETGAPVQFVQILLEEANLSTSTDEAGTFVIRHVAEGEYRLKTFRIGYRPLTSTVHISKRDTLRITLRLAPLTLQIGEVLVEVSGEDDVPFYEAPIQIEGRRLRQRLGTTIAETLRDEPGMAMRSMGPAPARPVLRGLGGERLLVLEDGGRTGDLAATSSDHALVVDPMSADRIEVIRGPEALAFGSNALGGVVNVVRGYIPVSQAERPQFGLAVQGNTVNSGYAGGLSATVPGGRLFAVKSDVSLRRSGNVSTPLGELDNTSLSTINGALGGALIRPWGRAGVAGSYYESRYGIPGGFVGAHPDGVDVRIDRRYVEARTELREPWDWMPRLDARASYSRYHHREFESNGNLGIEYGLLSYHGSVTASTRAGRRFRDGLIGLWGEYRDYAAGGFAFTPASVEWTVAGFAHQEMQMGRLTAQAGARYDIRRVEPIAQGAANGDHLPSPRSFAGFSASAMLVWRLSRSSSVGATAMQSIRMPGIEELYSEGPHLAAYSFEIGNERLQTERGRGVEVFGRHESSALAASFALYRNAIRGFIFPQNTGEINHRVFLPIYRHTGARAVMVGAEGRAELRLARRISVEIAASHVRGTFTRLNQPIPWIPPVRGDLAVRYRPGSFMISGAVRLAGAQRRLAPFEDRTNGYVVTDVAAQYHLTAGGALHTFDLGIQNVGNVVYHDHLSRVKSVMPEPGRNVKLLYRAYF